MGSLAQGERREVFFFEGKIGECGKKEGKGNDGGQKGDRVQWNDQKLLSKVYRRNSYGS